jgi:hypothetical protein
MEPHGQDTPELSAGTTTLPIGKSLESTRESMGVLPDLSRGGYLSSVVAIHMEVLPILIFDLLVVVPVMNVGTKNQVAGASRSILLPTVMWQIDCKM